MAKRRTLSSKSVKQADNALKKAAAKEPKSVRITEGQRRALGKDQSAGAPPS